MPRSHPAEPPRRGEDGAGHPASGYRGVIDPDVDLHDPVQRREANPYRWDLILATSMGGILGSEARYGVDLALPHRGNQFPWSTVLINASGCLLIGVLMVVLLDLLSPHRLARPFLGIGVLGGYTTYSTFAVDVQRLLVDHRPAIALAYIAVSLAGCGLAVTLGAQATTAAGRRILARRVPAERGQGAAPS